MPSRRSNPVVVTRLDGSRLTRGSVPAAMRTAVFLRDGLKCRYCGWTSGRVERFQIDHIVPQARGGLDALDNLCVACEVCNVHKGVNLWVPGRRLRDQPGYSQARWRRCRMAVNRKNEASRKRARLERERRAADCAETVLGVLMGD